MRCEYKRIRSIHVRLSFQQRCGLLFRRQFDLIDNCGMYKKIRVGSDDQQFFIVMNLCFTNDFQSYTLNVFFKYDENAAAIFDTFLRWC